MAASLKFDDILKEIKEKKFHPVYFLEGEESYYIDKIADALEELVVEEHERDFNQVVLYGKDSSVAEVVSNAKRFPMMAERQLVMVKEAQMLDKIDADSEKNQLLAYLEQPLDSTVLVFCYKHKTLDKRTRFSKLLKKKAVLYSSKKLYDSNIPSWIITYVSKRKGKIRPEAAGLISEYLGNDLAKIANSLNKLLLNVPASKPIDSAVIEHYIGISKDYNNFELQKAIGERDTLKANRIVNYYRENINKHPMVLTLSVLYAFFSKIMLIHSLRDKSQENLKTKLGVHPFFIKDYTSAARKYSPAKLSRIFNWLREYDMRSKGVNNSSVGHGELLQELVFKITHI